MMFISTLLATFAMYIPENKYKRWYSGFDINDMNDRVGKSDKFEMSEINTETGQFIIKDQSKIL